MNKRISILSKILPRYGEVLLAVGTIVSLEKALSENKVAIETLKSFLINNTKEVMIANRLFYSQKFQKIIYDYTGKPSGLIIAKAIPIDDDKKTNIYLVDFFSKSLWPIIVDRYMDNVCSSANAVKVAINIKKRVYTSIYGENEFQTFFSELKDYLYLNHIVVAKAQMKENGDMLVELLIPLVSACD